MSNIRSSSTRNIGQYRLVHQISGDYGKSSEGMADDIYRAIRHLKPKVLLDFGCGKSNLVDILASRLNAVAHRYDPAIPQFSVVSVSEADLIINTDVMEHLDEDEVPIVLEDIAKFGGNVIFNISIRPAGKILPNGENAHATVREATWWREQIEAKFPVCYRVFSALDEARFVTWRPPLTFRIADHLRWRLKRIRGVLGRIRRRELFV